MATNHGGEFVPVGPTHDMAYEPDKFGVKTILAVPVVVIVTAFLAFVITWILFANIFDPRKRGPVDMPAAAARGEQPLNERLGRISSTDPNAEVNNPRLEGLVVTKKYYRDGNPENTDPDNVVTAEITSMQPVPEGNSPRYRAEDLWPDRVPELRKGGAEGMPLDRAMAELAAGGLLKVRPGAVHVGIDPEWDRPKESNGGRSTRTADLPAPLPPKKKELEKAKEPEEPKEPEPDKKTGEGKKE